MRSCKLGDHRVTQIVDGLVRSKAPGIKSLNLSDNQIGQKGAESLGQLMLRNQTVTSLDLSWNEVRPQELRYDPSTLLQ